MIRHQHLQLVLILLVGATLRFWHLDWGTNPEDGRFHAMQPDEKTLIHASSQLAESLRPTLSGYGTLSLYLPWVTWPVAQVLSIDLFDENHPRDTFILCRALSATAGLAAVVLTWILGCRLGDRRVGLLAAALLAVATLSVQQAHYYTVDSLFSTVALLAILLCLRALEHDHWRDWFASGAIVGLAAGLRINGLILMAPVLCAAVLATRSTTAQALSRGTHLRRTVTRCALAGGTALAVLFCLQPYMLLDPQLYLGHGGVGNLRNAAAIATGELPRIWTLYDSAQTPYWFHLTNLLLHATGPGLQITGLAGLVWFAFRRRTGDLICLAFVLTFVLLIGRLEAKNIRYLTPIIPFLCISAGALLVRGTEDTGRLRRGALP